jgi:hypothetical protein
MTIQQAKIILFDYFQEADFITHKDLAGLIDPGTNRDVAMSAFLLALSDLTAAGVVGLNPVCSTSDNSTLIWNLKDNLVNRPQTIIISGRLATNISEIVNSFAETTDQDEICADPLNITERDLSVLCGMISFLSNQNSSADAPPEPPQEEIKKKIK